MANDDDCGCGKQIKQNQAKRAAPVVHTHSHDMTPVRGLKPDALHARMLAEGWTPDAGAMGVSDEAQHVIVWRRETPKGGLGHNDTLITLTTDSQVQLFRLSETKPLEMILSGKAPPA